jgi:hypothetical protein
VPLVINIALRHDGPAVGEHDPADPDEFVRMRRASESEAYTGSIFDAQSHGSPPWSGRKERRLPQPPIWVVRRSGDRRSLSRLSEPSAFVDVAALGDAMRRCMATHAPRFAERSVYRRGTEEWRLGSIAATYRIDELEVE